MTMLFVILQSVPICIDLHGSILLQLNDLTSKRISALLFILAALVKYIDSIASL